MQKRRYIVHVDMDAFFAAIEQRDNPGLRGKPVIVGADPKAGRGRGVVSTCCYEARKFGIHSAMPISIAYRKCPDATFLPPDMEKYSRISDEIYSILYDFTPQIEPVSIDESFLNITGTYHLFGAPRQTCLLIKSKIKEKTHLTASVGLAPTKMAAKIASDLGKPDGLFEVTEEKLLDFLMPLDIGKIWGVGKKTQAILNNMGIRTIGELAKMDVGELIDMFGKNGAHLWQLANGIDERAVETEGEVKSISNEFTFDKDTLDKEKIEGTLESLCEKVSGRLREAGLRGRTATLKIRLEDFSTYTRAATLHQATNFADILYRQTRQLYENFNAKGKRVRLIGVRVSNLLPLDYKDTLFSKKTDKKREEVHKTIDKIKKKFGESSIRRAGSRGNKLFLLLSLVFFIQLYSAPFKAAYSEDKEVLRYTTARESMVVNQIKARGIKDKRVLAAMHKVERHRFIPKPLRYLAYTDGPLPIGEGQTISQPYIVALMTELLELEGDEKVLEIGTGSGYQAAVLAEVCAHVYTIEILGPLATRSKALLEELGYANITVKCGDGFPGWQEFAPFDAIIVTCAPPEVPQPLIEQLKDGGRLVIPVGSFYQELKLIEKKNGKLISESIIPVRFVPMLRKED